MLHLFRDWEKLQLRASDYKNHRIFTLRCIHKELVPVSIKLKTKTTLRTDRARKIIRTAETHLLQARVKAINSTLDNIARQTELCRSKLASILSTHMFGKCQGFVEKVGEIRFNKVKHRQVNKFNNLLRKEGNIIGVSTQLTTFNSSQAGRQVGDIATSQVASTVLPNSSIVASQAGRQAGSVSSSQAGREQCYLPGSQCSSS